MRSPDIPPPQNIQYGWEPFELGSVMDVLTLCFALIGLVITGWFAYRQLMGTNRQTAIALEQHHRDLARDAKRSVLTLFLSNASHGQYAKDGIETHRLFIKNEGQKADRGIWFCGVPKIGGVQIASVEGCAPMPLTPEDVDRFGSVSDDYRITAYRLSNELLPGEQIVCCSVTVRRNPEPQPGWRTVLWLTRTPDGQTPTNGFSTIELPVQRTNSYD